MVEHDVPDINSLALAEAMAKLTCSSPAVTAASAIFTIEKEASLPVRLPQRHNTQPTPVKLPTEHLSFLTKQPGPTPTKQRTWSFTHHPNPRAHYCSRSISPPTLSRYCTLSCSACRALEIGSGPLCRGWAVEARLPQGTDGQERACDLLT